MEDQQELSPNHLKRKNPTTTRPSSSSSFVHRNVVPINVKRPKDEFGCSSTVDDDDNNLVGQFLDDRHVVVDDVTPIGFLDPLPPLERELFNTRHNINSNSNSNYDDNNNININVGVKNYELKSSRKQFWKAGDYEAPQAVAANAFSSSYSGGLDHVRVHPRFLHSNATSHKWVLGAFAELLDNALDEVCNGATYVSVDMVYNKKDRHTMLLADKDRHRMLQIQDNGGGMNPDKMRQCMSLGYSAKSKIANVIGQYGNGFKTSTMRLGADVIVFSMCHGKDNTSATRSIGMLSYTFLTSTGKQDIVVPMVDYEKKGNIWTKMLRSSLEDWHTNLETIVQWSPFSSEQELLQQFNTLGYQGTRIVIYNLWEDDQRQLELDFGTDPEDIQIRGVNRDDKKITMATKYPNSKHFLTYQHSLRSYASILYLRLPPGFRIILRGKDVVHHNLVNDMMHPKQVSYKPVPITDGTVKESIALYENLHALVTLGFVKDAVDHIDIQGFNVYHKNRLIKPFWRVWNAAGSDGRGVIGVLEANFVEPAHDKQGFEKTTALSRLEARLIVLQKTYWRENCHEIGYAPRRQVNKASTVVSSPSNKANAVLSIKGVPTNKFDGNTGEIPETSQRTSKKADRSLPVIESSSDEEMPNLFESPPSKTHNNRPSSSKAEPINGNLHTYPEVKTDVQNLRKEISELKNRLLEATEARDRSLQELEFERDRSKSFEVQLELANKKIAEMDKEQEALIAIFAEERERRDVEEAHMRRRIEKASSTIGQLVADRVKDMERAKFAKCKSENE